MCNSFPLLKPTSGTVLKSQARSDLLLLMYLFSKLFLSGSSKRSASYRARTGNNPPGPSGGSTSSSANGGLRPCPTCQMGGGGSRREKKLSERRQRRQSADSDSTTPSPSPTLGGVTKYEILSSSSAEDGTKPKLISRMGKRNIKAQVKRFKMETKAAKTLGK